MQGGFVNRVSSALKRWTSLWLVTLLLVPAVAGNVEENRDFQPIHEGVDFPVGWTEFQLNGPFSPQVRMVYPAMVAGEDQEMAGNGPFPWTILIGDSGEAIDGYMMLTESLVKRGYIVVVSQPMADETDVDTTLDFIDAVMSHMVYQNQTNGYVMGSASNIDVEHWGLLGHGKGATASYLAFPFWGLSGHADDHQPPRGLVGFGLDLEELGQGFAWQDVTMNPVFSTPNTALFMTGTVDEISPSQPTMERVEAIGGIAWQWMHVLGADHYQFQDTRSIFENDGDATMSQSAQIQLAADHTVAYLDTVLRGDTGRFRDAFNRDQGPRTVSDGSAYVDEALQASSFLRWSDIVFSHNGSQALNASNTFSMQVNWSLRNGDGFADLPSGWDVNVSCGWTNAAWETNAVLEVNGAARCDFPMAPVAPGAQEAWMRVEVEGAPSTLRTTVIRENTPIDLLYPQPTVYVAQHGTALLNISDVAIDPDGQAVRALSASLIGQDAPHFEAELDASGLFVRVHHALDEEWLGECMVELHLRSDGGVTDEVNTTLRVMLTPVDDQVVKDGTVPIQEMNEDGAPVVFDLSTVVSDPEGESLLIRVGGQAVGEQGPVRFTIDEHHITLTPLENLYGATVLRAMVSDGYNPPIDLDIPVVVHPVNDPVVVNTSLWTGDVVMNEDDRHVLDVSQLAYDVDGDELTWTLEGAPAALEVERTNASFILKPAQDFNGLVEGLWLNVTDGSSSYTFGFNLVVNPVGDLPFVAISSVQRLDGGSMATMQWSVLDVDGVANTDAEVFVDSKAVSTNHSCLENTPGVYQCVTLVPLGELTNSSVYLQIKITDHELDRSVLADYVFDPNQAQQNQTTSPPDVQGGLLQQNGMLLLGLTALVLVGVLGWVWRTTSPKPPGNAPASTRSATEDVTEKTGGLLARAERLK